MSKSIHSSKPLLGVFACCLVLGSAGPACSIADAPASGSDATEILWDSYGIPHIFARTESELFYAFGWAQATAHGDLLLRLYGQSRGRGAEYWGEDYLALDRWVRTVDIPDLAASWYEQQGTQFREYLERFAAGINDYARLNPDRIADEVEAVLPVNAIDVMAHQLRIIHFTFIASPGIVEAAESWLESNATTTDLGPSPLGSLKGAPKAGSNAWAVAPSRSASGNAMLVANPHLPWSDLFTWFEAQLAAPGMDAYGATLVGSPGLGIAFNDYLGWTHTVNTYDGADLYALTLDGEGYRWDGGLREFELQEHTLTIRSDDEPREESLTVRRSVHGPLIAERNGRAVALRVAGLEESQLLEQWWSMARATNLDEFEAALERLQIPMFTVLYADRDGHILHLFGGRVPVRSSGDWRQWSGIVGGDTSATLWTETHAYGDLPRVLDPPTGWLQNANDPPWTTTDPRALNPDDYPAYMAPRGPGFNIFRPQRSARMLAEDDRISYDELMRYKHSTRMELADRLVDELVDAARVDGSETLAEAAGVLETWDRAADANSRGAVLFAAWAREMGRSLFRNFASPWNEEEPFTTPSGIDDPSVALAALESAAGEIKGKYGTLDVPWGEIYRLRRDGLDLPGNGGPGFLGIFRVVGYAPEDDGFFRAAGGDSYVAAIEFGETVQAMALIGYGNASQPGSAHRADQLQLFSDQELRPVWRTRAEVEANLSARESF